MDINAFTELTEHYQVKVVRILDKAYHSAFKIHLKPLKVRNSYVFTGDGFMAAAEFPKGSDVAFFKAFLGFAIELHCKVRSEFCKLDESEPLFKESRASLRMGIHKDLAYGIHFSKPKRNLLFFGKAVNFANRIMDHGVGWDILISETTCEGLLEPVDQGVATFFGHAFCIYRVTLPKLATVEIHKCPGLYYDKHRVAQTLCRIVSVKNNRVKTMTIGSETDPPRGPKRFFDTLHSADVNHITKIINACAFFDSISLLPPSVWLTDPSLFFVLIAQAAKRKKKLFRRIFIWEHSDYIRGGRDLEQLHDLSGVQMQFISLTDARQKANEFFVEQMKSLPDKQSTDPDLTTFIQYPLREFWVSYDKSEVLSAGYGKEEKNKKASHGFDVVYLQHIAKGGPIAQAWFNHLWKDL